MSVNQPHPPVPRIPDAEWEVMRIIWRRGSATTGQVIDNLPPEKHWNPRTTQTLLMRLTKRGVLRTEPEGRAFRYFPVVSENECLREEGQGFLKRFFGGGLRPFLAHFLRQGAVSDEELDALRALLEQEANARARSCAERDAKITSP